MQMRNGKLNSEYRGLVHPSDTFLDVARPRSDARPDFRSVRGSESWEAIARRGVPVEGVTPTKSRNSPSPHKLHAYTHTEADSHASSKLRLNYKSSSKFAWDRQPQSIDTFSAISWYTP
eukprot:4173914-Pyramimonas_sp.AAC.1